MKQTMNIPNLNDVKQLFFSKSAIEMKGSCHKIEQYCNNETQFRACIEQITEGLHTCFFPYTLSKGES